MLSSLLVNLSVYALLLQIVIDWATLLEANADNLATALALAELLRGLTIPLCTHIYIHRLVAMLTN